MKFDAKTLQILKNFSTINPALIFKAGNVISTISTTKSILAKAEIEQEIPRDFAIFDLSRFLSVMSTFDEPEIEIGEKFMTIKQNKKKVNYTFAEPALILSPPSKEIVLPEEGRVSFNVEDKQLSELMKVMSILGLPEFCVVGDGETISIEATNSKERGSHSFSSVVGETDKKFCFYIKAEYMKMLPGTYEVVMSSKGLSTFKSENVQYWITMESHSSYEN